MKKSIELFSIILLFFQLNLISASGNYDFTLNSSENVPSKEILDIGSRLELFVDNYLIDHFKGKAKLRLHHPEPKEIAIEFDEPWEGSGCGYNTVFQDEKKYRMYYKAYQITVTPDTLKAPDRHPFFTCYAESDDGIHWYKPKLGICEFEGSKANNILFDNPMGGMNTVSAFEDGNPAKSPDALYKAIARANKSKFGLYVFKSPDAIHWTLLNEYPVITDGAFDSQNLAFWDSYRGEYRAYWRYFTEGVIDMDKDIWKPKGIRAIRTATSRDLINWENQADLKYVDSPDEQLYTNQIKPYYRAPHIFIGFPTRYIDRGWSESMRALPEAEHREWRAKAVKRAGTALSEGLFMASRDGVTFKRWNETFLRPGIERKGTWNYGNQYIAWSVVETKSDLEGAPDELSLYAMEGYWTGTSSSLRRYTLRIDGFVSVNAPMSGGELITKPLTFTGKNLILNFSSSAAGDIRTEIQDQNGDPIPGFTMDDCPPVFGDSLERTVTWKNGSDLSSLEGKVVRLRFVLKDADLFSIQFK